MRRLPWLLVLLAFPAYADESCLKCHNDKAELTKALEGKKFRPGLLIDPKKAAASVHGTQDCGDCHFEYETFPHPKEAETPHCGECHEDAQKQFEAGIHSKTPEGKDPVDCASCHGVHDTLKSDHEQSRLYPLNLHKTCGKCHDGYVEDVHGRHVAEKGLRVSANCSSCHGSHATRVPIGMSSHPSP